LTLASTTNLPGAAQYGPLIDNLNLAALPPSGSTFFPFIETFAGTQPGSNDSSVLAGSQFAVLAGNVDVFGNLLNGAPSAFFSCPSGVEEPANCIDLNGDTPGAIQSTTLFDLIAGTTYQVSFLLAGNVADGTHASYPLSVSLGDSGAIGFSAQPGAGFGLETFDYTPTQNEPQAELRFVSGATTGNPLYGPFVDDIEIDAIPEPASAAIFLTALAALRAARRRR
jgi:hypothetical protein